MEQSRNPSLTKEEKEKRQKEIMSIQDRETRIKAIARNKELFTGKKEG